MKHMSHVFRDADSLRDFLDSADIRDHAAAAQSILVQIYAAEMSNGVRDIATEITRSLPGCTIVGATTCGELAQGRTLVLTTVIGISFFEATALHPILLPCAPGQEQQVGTDLARRIGELDGRVAAVLLLSTPLSINVAVLLDALRTEKVDYPLFGGGAADYGAMSTSFVLYGTELHPAAAVAVALIGDRLQVELRTYLGWNPLSKEMTVTAVDGMVVKTVDGRPAFELYQRYLGIPNDQNFYTNTLEFPFLFERQGLTVSRAPVGVDADLGVQFVADIAVGEKFRIGYGSPDLIIADAITIRNLMRDFAPEALFLFTCSCRRFFLLDDVELETLPFEDVAPTFGFYTYGEFFGQAGNLHLLNSTMVAAGLRESPPTTSTVTGADLQSLDGKQDPLSNTHVKVVSRLLQFIRAVTDELEQANVELTRLSVIDRLTQTYNRVRLDSVLLEAIANAHRSGAPFSVVLLDIDHFKQVNDRHGHLTGDAVLVGVARSLSAQIRMGDTLGRWGGEEFLLVLPNTGLAQAETLADAMRKVIEQIPFERVGHVTSSFGVASYSSSDTVTSLLARADDALYDAKRTGRNRVVARPGLA